MVDIESTMLITFKLCINIIGRVTFKDTTDNAFLLDTEKVICLSSRSHYTNTFSFKQLLSEQNMKQKV